MSGHDFQHFEDKSYLQQYIAHFVLNRGYWSTSPTLTVLHFVLKSEF